METEKLEPTHSAEAKPNGAPMTPTPEPGVDSNPENPRSRKGTAILFVGIVAVVLIGLAIWKGAGHSTAEKAQPAVVVGVVKVVRADLYNEVPLPAEFRPYVEVDLHAKVAGYVDKMNVDFGDHVKAGQLLATLEVPELRDQLHNAMAMQQKAEADYTNADLGYQRLKTVSEKNPTLVAQQDIDDAFAKKSAADAAIAAAKADVERYQTLMNYTRITAPFDGVVTHRYADPGALIQSGTSSDTQSLPLFRVSDNYHLRLDFPVSVDYVKDIHLGDKVEVRVDSLDGKSFEGTVSRFTDRVNMDTRTMIVEVEVPNPKLEIVPGMYAEVHFKYHQQQNVLAVPVQCVAGDKQRSVYVINQNSEIEPRNVTVGLETPDRCEISAGLKEGELVMIGNRALVQPGEKVETKIVTEPTMQ